ncbi:MAG: polysaccharide deacetylase family protein [Gemmatimonadota bacterium]
MRNSRAIASRLKHRARAVVTNGPVPWLFRYFMKGAVPVFMLHRFEDRALGVVGHSQELVRRHLGWLREHGFRFLSLADLVRELTESPDEIGRAVAITVDDGYAGFARFGQPILAEFDVPATVFLTTGFIDRTMWFWWDRIDFALKHNTRRRCDLTIAQLSMTLTWADEESRVRVRGNIVEHLKLLLEEDRLAALEQITSQSSVEVPHGAPPSYAPLSWDNVRSLAQKGITFGPHTVTHPILSRVSDAQSAMEIRESWRRLKDETTAAVPIFCYPNGREVDFTAREMDILKREGFTAAFTATAGYAEARDFSVVDSVSRYRVRRYPFPDRHEDLVQIASGIERAKDYVRNWNWR